MTAPTGDDSGAEASLAPPLSPEIHLSGAQVVSPAERTGHRESGTKLGRELLLWALTVLILAFWWHSEWTFSGGSSTNASTSGAFRNYVATSMLVHDEYTQKGYEGPGFMKWLLELEAIPGDVHDAFSAVDQEGLMTDTLHVDLALVSLRFSQDGREDADDWKQLALKSLQAVSEEGQSETYYRMVNGAVKGHLLTEVDRDEMANVLRNHADDWWMGFLASHYKMEPHGNQIALQQAQESALGDFVFAAVLIVNLTLLGLLAIPAAWSALSRKRPAMPASHQRLFRLWPGPWVVGLFGFTALAALLLNHYFFPSVYQQIALLVTAVLDPFNAWHILTGLWLTWVTAMAALPIIPLYTLYSPRFSRLAGVLGFRSRDFAYLPYWGLGCASMGLLPWLFHFVDAGLASLGSASSVLDGLSRSFSDQGELALPLGIFWSVVMAPFVEEIIFRGFIFRSVQARWGTLVGVLVSSFVFAGSHFYSVNGTIHVFLYGLLFCWVYQRTGKLAASMFIHAGSNLAVTLLAHFSGG